MKNLLWTTFVLTFFVNIGIAQKYIGNYANFQIVNGTVYWQVIYPCPSMTQDSIVKMIISATQKDPAFTLVKSDDKELIFRITEKPLRDKGHIYAGTVVVEAKPGKYRVTFNEIKVKGADPQATLDKTKKYFDQGAYTSPKLEHLTKLNEQFAIAFDFKNYSAAKDW